MLCALALMGMYERQLGCFAKHCAKRNKAARHQWCRLQLQLHIVGGLNVGAGLQIDQTADVAAPPDACTCMPARLPSLARYHSVFSLAGESIAAAELSE